MKIRIVLFEQQKPLFIQHYHTLGMRAQLKLLQLFFYGIITTFVIGMVPRV